ncbi:MAG: polysaccharide deacetylase family protein [Clostridia bacterium]|nr:polysaccharide deacetylase family protein [Clostridia bacterium]
MKARIISVFLLVALALSITSISCTAASREGWYIIKHENSTPDFPYNAKTLSSHSCYYIDQKASDEREKILYLTFDAGYENGNIESILDTLKEEGVSAAFFILSNLLLKNTQLVERMFCEGHTVCNHTSKHRDLTTLCDSEIEGELTRLEEQCFEKTGKTPEKFFRYPEGVYNEHTVDIIEKLGYKSFFWSIAYADWDNNKQPEPEAALKSLSRQLHPGAIILMHPTSQTNAKIMKDFIYYCRNAGYEFGSLRDLISRNK